MFYPYAGSVAGTSLPVMHVVLAAATLAALFAIAIVMWPKNRAQLVGLLWFVGCLVPVIGVVQAGDQSMADRYSYFPQIGLIAGIVFGIAPLIHRHSAMIGWAVATSAVVAAFSIRTTIEIGYWSNDITLFSRALEITDHNYIAHDGLGYAFAAKGDTAAAESQYRLSIAARPDYYQSHMEPANILKTPAGSMRRCRTIDMRLNARRNGSSAITTLGLRWREMGASKTPSANSPRLSTCRPISPPPITPTDWRCFIPATRSRHQRTRPGGGGWRKNSTSRACSTRSSK